MALKAIKSENTIILHVIPADVNVENQVSVEVVNEIDPKGYRTIGVYTKLDRLE